MSRQSLWQSSAESWLALMERGDINRVEVLDAPMLRLSGEVEGIDVLDVGCGEGRFCRMLGERGARVTGLDPTPKLLEAACAQDPAGRYLEGSGEALPYRDDSFDLVVSYLVLVDIPDYRRAIREMERVLRPGGRVLVANLNPFCTTLPDPNERDADGRRIFLRVSRYSAEAAHEVGWAGLRIVNHHRPLSAYMQAFLASGFRLMDFEEPLPTCEAIARRPKLAEDEEIPIFHVMQWRKDAR